MNSSILDFVEYLVPGDHVDLESYSEVDRNKLLDEIEGRGYQINSRNIIGIVDSCEACDGEGTNRKGKGCHVCDSTGYQIDFGKGKEPFYD